MEPPKNLNSGKEIHTISYTPTDTTIETYNSKYIMILTIEIVLESFS